MSENDGSDSTESNRNKIRNRSLFVAACIGVLSGTIFLRNIVDKNVHPKPTAEPTSAPLIIETPTPPPTGVELAEYFRENGYIGSPNLETHNGSSNMVRDVALAQPNGFLVRVGGDYRDPFKNDPELRATSIQSILQVVAASQGRSMDNSLAVVYDKKPSIEEDGLIHRDEPLALHGLLLDDGSFRGNRGTTLEIGQSATMCILGGPVIENKKEDSKEDQLQVIGFKVRSRDMKDAFIIPSPANNPSGVACGTIKNDTNAQLYVSESVFDVTAETPIYSLPTITNSGSEFFENIVNGVDFQHYVNSSDPSVVNISTQTNISQVLATKNLNALPNQ